MDSEENKSSHRCDKFENTLQQLDETFLRRILGRKSSGRLSFRINHENDKPGEVPFQWELQPGKPKKEVLDKQDIPAVDLSDDEIMVPISPPPAAHSVTLATRSVVVTRKQASWVWFWKKMKKSHQIKRHKIILQGTDSYSNSTGNSDTEDYVSMPSSSSISIGSSKFSTSSFESNDQASHRPSKLGRLIRWAFEKKSAMVRV